MAKNGPLFVQALQPDGEVSAARRYPDDEQTPGPDGKPPRLPVREEDGGVGGDGARDAREAGEQAEADAPGVGSDSGAYKHMSYQQLLLVWPRMYLSPFIFYLKPSLRFCVKADNNHKP